MRNYIETPISVGGSNLRTSDCYKVNDLPLSFSLKRDVLAEMNQYDPSNAFVSSGIDLDSVRIGLSLNSGYEVSPIGKSTYQNVAVKARSELRQRQGGGADNGRGATGPAGSGGQPGGGDGSGGGADH